MAQHQGLHSKIIMLEMPMKEIATRYPIFFFLPEDILAKSKGPGLHEQGCDSRWI